MSKFFASLRGQAPSVAVLAIIIVFSALRVKLYGDPALSIAGNDTPSYVESSRVPLFSAEMWTGRRLLTTNLIYKALEPEGGYQITVNGSLQTTRRALQPGFERIAILQLVLSLLGWGALAWFVSANLRDAWMKIIAAAVILAFAFTPHMADWDSILMSESLTFSLFALQFALLIKIAFALHREPGANIPGWVAIWGLAAFLWTFLRDTNVFTALVTIGMVAVLTIAPRYRKNKTLIGAALFLTLTFALGFFTASASVRAVVQVRNLYRDDVFPNPGMVAAFQELGMPADDFDSPEFESWLLKRGSSTFIRFALAHPGYVALKLWRDFPDSFDEIQQTYFTARDLNPARGILFEIGNALHPESTTPFLASVLGVWGVLALAKRNAEAVPWAWLGLWLFFSAAMTLVPTILGDTWAINRHALYSSTVFRLGLWLYPVILIDLSLGGRVAADVRR